MFKFSLFDSVNNTSQKVSSNGEAITRVYDYSEPYFKSLSVDNDVYNVVEGVAGWRFVITGILVASSKAITNEKTVHIYEAITADSSDHETLILTLDMVKNERVYLPLTHVATKNGRHINAHADDSVFNITVFGYKVPAG